MSSRKKKEEEEKRKQEQGYRRRQTNQSGTGQKSAIAGIKQAVAEKEAQINAQQAANRKSTDTHANSGGGTVEKIANAVAKKAAETAAKASESRTGQSVAQEIKAEAERAAKKAAEKAVSKAEASRQEKNKNRKSTDTRANSGKNAVQDVKNSVQKLAERLGSTEKGKKAIAAEKGMQRILDQYRVLDDLEARTAQRRSNILNNREVPGAGTGAAKELLGTETFRPRWSPYAPDSMSFPTPSGLDRMAKDLDLRSKAYGLGKEKVSMADILAATALDPLSALKADSKSYANFGRGYGMKSKPWDAGLTDKEKVHAAADRVKAWNRRAARNQSAAEQTLSPADRKLREQFQDEIRLAKADYDAAKARGDTAGMQAAHKRAETWRRIEGGYSGGAAGNEHITPKLEQSDIAALNKTGQTQLRAAKLGYQNAQTDQERARYAAMGQDIRRNPAYLKETYDRGAYRETDANGRMRYAGTAEERAKEAEQAAAIPKAAATGVAGAFASLPEVTGKALQADANASQEALQRLSDIRGGGKVSIPAPAPVSPDSLGQRLMQQSAAYREQATEGQNPFERKLTEGMIGALEMAPMLLTSAATGGAALPAMAVFGAQAAGGKMGELAGAGADPRYAAGRGAASGAIAAMTGAVPYGRLMSIVKGPAGATARGLTSHALSGIGAMETDYLANIGLDYALGDKNARPDPREMADIAVNALVLSSIMGGSGAAVRGLRNAGGSRQTGLPGSRTATAAETGALASSEALAAREQAVRAEIETWKIQTNRTVDRLRNSGNDQTYRRFLLGELARQEQQGQALRERLEGIQSMQRQAQTQPKTQAQAREAGAELAENWLNLHREDQSARQARQSQAWDTALETLQPRQSARRPSASAEAPTPLGYREESAGRLDSRKLPLAEEPERRAAQEKIMAGEPLSMKERMMERDAGSMAKTIAARDTKTDHAYRVIPLDQWNQEYAPSGKITRNAPEFDPNGDQHASNGGIDWYLGGYSKRYGGKQGTVVILETPAAADKFQLAQDNGTRMVLDPTIRHIKSSSQANPVELAELTGAWKWDKRTGEMTEIDLSPWKKRAEATTPPGFREASAGRETSARYGQAENHIDNRQSQDLGDRRVKAFQWDHPEVKPFFRKAAAELKQQVEYADSTKTAQRASAIQQARGKKAGTVMAKNGPIRRLMDQGLSTTEIIKACDAIIHDQGQENYAAAKRVELVLDNMLSHGYLPVEMAGVWDENAIVAPNTDYLRVKETLPGAVTRGSFADYLRRNELALELGEVTEEQLRQEWEAERRVREDRESLYRSAESWGQEPRRYRTMEDELAAHAQRVSQWMDEPEMQDMPEEYWERYWQQAREEERLIREKWAGREAQTPRVREYVDPETGELVLETRIPVEEAGTAPAVTEAPVRTETVREEGQKNTPREAEESTAVNTNPARHTAEEQAAIEAHQNSTEAERNGKSDEEAENVSDQDPYSVGAAPGGFDPYSRMANEYGTIEPGENPARMVDVPLSTNGEDRVRRGVRTIMEAQITPDEAIQAFEDEVVKGTFSYHPRKDKASVEAATQTLEDKGYWGAMQQWQDVTEGRRAAGKDDIVLAQFLYAEAARAKDIDTMRKLAAEIAAEATVAGQQVQAMRLLKKATPEGKVYYIHRLVSKMQAELEEGRGDKAPTLTIDPALEERLLDAEDEESQQEVIDEIYDQVAEQLPKTFADRLNAWRYFAMLGNPRTHIRNVVGNILVQVPLQVSNKASALAQAATQPKEKRTRAVIASRAAKQFARADYQEMKRVLSDGDKYASDESAIRRRQKLFPAPVQALMDANSKALEAEDMIFKRGTYIQDMASFLTAKGWDVENLTESQLEQARSHAIKEAKHATFQDASAFASWLAKQERKNKVTKVAIGGLMPFKGVPVNIAKMGFELSPAGVVKAVYDGATKVRKGEMDATDMIDHLTRGMTGTAIAGLGYFLAAQGMLTAGAGDDEKENDFEMAQGGQNYALDLGDLTYTLDWAAPSAIPLFLGAEYWNARNRMEQSGEGAEGNEDGEEDGKQFKEGLEALTRLFDPMLNMTVLSGVSDTLKTVSYSRVNAIFPMAWSIGQNYAGQVVPTLLGQIARTADDTRRTTYADRDSRVPNGIQKFIQRQENKIPGLSQRNLPWLDVWGREDREENPAVRALENFISPGYISRKNTSEMEQELKRLNDLGFEGVLPSKARTSTKINDKYLTRGQYETLVKTQGGEARSMLEQVIGSAGYNALTDEEKAAYVKKIFDFSRQEGKLAVGMPEEKADKYVLKAREGKETLGLDPADFLALYVTKSLIDKDETEEDKTMKAIDFSLAVDARDDLTEEQKAFVKDSVKFYNMFPVSTAGFEKGVAAGLTAEESKDMLRLKKQADTDGNGSYTNAELYDVIQSTGKSEEEKAKLWEAMKPSNSNKSWSELDKENKAAEATRKQWAASVGNVSQETINGFQESVNAIGGYSSMSYTAFFDLMDSMGVPESQRSGYYAIVQSNKAHPWKKTYAQAKKYKGR